MLLFTIVALGHLQYKNDLKSMSSELLKVPEKVKPAGKVSILDWPLTKKNSAAVASKFSHGQNLMSSTWVLFRSLSPFLANLHSFFN